MTENPAEIPAKPLPSTPQPGENFYEWMEFASRRPAMFTGFYSIEALETFIRGYFFALDKKGIDGKNFPHFEWHFHQWVGGRLDVEYELSWSRMLFDYCGQDNKKALKVFAELFQEFRQVTPVVSVLRLTAQHRGGSQHTDRARTPNCTSEKYALSRHPELIYRMRLPPGRGCWLIYLYEDRSRHESFDPRFQRAMEEINSDYHTSAHEWKPMSIAESERFYRDMYVEQTF